MGAEIVVLHGCDVSGPTTARPGNAPPGAMFFDTTLNELLVSTGSVWVPVGVAGVAGSVAAGAAGSIRRISKLLTALADNTMTDIATVTVPNALLAAGLSVTLSGALGDGDSCQTALFHGGISRIAGAATKCTFGTATGAGRTAGATANATVAIQASAMSGAVGATQTFTIQASVARSAGAAANHILLAEIDLRNLIASGITIAAA